MKFDLLHALNLWIWSCILFLAIWISYSYFVYPAFGYARIEFTPSFLRFLFAILGIGLICVGMSLLNNFATRLPVLFLHIFLVIPTFVYWAIAHESTIYLVNFTFSFLLMIWISRLNFGRIKTIKSGYLLLFSLIAIIFGLYLLGFQTKGYLRYINFNLFDVYSFREDVLADSFSGVYGYVKEWIIIIYIIGISYAFKNKQFLLVVLILGLIFLHFAITSSKVFLFVGMLLIYTLIVFDPGSNKMFYKLLRLFSYAIISASILDFFTQTAVVSGLVTYRTFLAPAVLNFQYYEFFQSNPHTYLAGTKLGFFADNPYSVPVAEIIGLGFWGSGNENFSNTGIWGTGYQHFGFIGLYIYSIVLGAILSIFSSLIRADYKHRVWLVPAFSIIFLNFRQGDLPTIFLTNGILFFLLIIFLLTKQKFSN